MVLLQVENLTKSFGDKLLFEHINFGLDQGQRIALVAENGAGKTTLMRIIMDQESKDEGTISFRKDIRIGFLEQQPNFLPGQTVLEACFHSDSDVVKAIARYEDLLKKSVNHPNLADELQLAMSAMDQFDAWNFETEIKQILGKLSITDLSQRVDELSGGQQKRLALANVLITKPDLLLLDEPTNHLDLAMVEWLEDYLDHAKMSLLMVTHDRYFLDRVCSDIYEIDHEELFHYKGNYSYYLEKKEERMQNLNAETVRAKNLYKKELTWMRRQPQARATKAQSRIDSFYDIEERAKRRIEDNKLQLGVKATYLGSKIFEAQYISKAYGELTLLKDFYYNFSRYEKMGIVGKNGTGKSTFIKMLLGEVKPDSGKFDIGETVKFAYFSQDGMDFNPGMKVIDAVRNIAEVVDLGQGRKLTASQFLTHFMFQTKRQQDYIEKLSGGERRRLYLCTVLMRSPNFLVLDEPTNDLDIPTLNILEDYLIHFQGCVIVVSHDRFFMDKVVDHLLVFQGNAKVKDFPGNYTDYRQWSELKKTEAQEAQKLQEEVEKEAAKSQGPLSGEDSTGAKAWQQPRQKVKLSFNEKREYERLTQEIEALETEKVQVEQAMAEGKMSTDELIEASNRFQTINKELDAREMRWLELDELS